MSLSFVRAKMNTVPERPERFDPVDPRMIDAARQPETGIEPAVVNNGSSKPNSRLKDDPALLSIHGHWAAGACQGPPSVEDLTQQL
jgi:hypothetical protein